MVQLLSDGWSVAKKEHRCVWCGETIEIGVLYYRSNLLFCGEFQSQAWHAECHDAFWQATDVEGGIDPEDGFTPYDFIRGTDRPR